MRNRRSTLTLLTIIGAVLLCGGGLFLAGTVNVQGSLSLLEVAYLRVWLNTNDEALQTMVDSSNTTQQLFVVNPGDSAATIGQNLVQSNLITDADLFRNYARYHGLDAQLEAGTYFLSPAQTIPTIAQTLTDSSTASVTVQILEGWRREEIAAAIDATPHLQFSGAAFLQATGPGAVIPADFATYVTLPPGASLEGFLYPDTYFVPPAASATEFRDTLLATFLTRVVPALPTAPTTGLNLYETVTLASIVDREAVHAEEQPQIASVYLNRINDGMKLDADPTVQYGIGYQNGSWWPSITQDDYTTAQSPYNTYLNPGLPPGPIANPSLTAIQAAAIPADTPYYYFRADCTGTGYHVFALTFDEHVANGNCP
ncbi:endolytic transglycosylase MltG [Chloroflexota bacterium]